MHLGRSVLVAIGLVAGLGGCGAVDRNRIAAWASAGGHLAALLGTSGGLAALEDLSQGHPDQSSRVQSVVDWFGPTDYRLVDANQQLNAALLLGCPIVLCPDRAALLDAESSHDRTPGVRHLGGPECGQTVWSPATLRAARGGGEAARSPSAPNSRGDGPRQLW
jgi:hypothetical protein